jgi:hypothetical protein
VKKLNLNAIRIDGGTQSRVQINTEIVADYAEAIRVGIDFPPVVVFHDGADYWLADGFHRYHAHRSAEKASIQADVQPGSLEDAQLYATGANGSHGLYRSNADKRKAVTMTLAIPRCADWSDRKIAEHCKVSVPFVSAIRRPAVAVKQQEHRAAAAEKKAAGRNPITAAAPAPAPEEKPSKTAKRELPKPPETDNSDAIAEAQHTITELAQENEQLRDKLATESLMDSEEAKTQTAETIRELRALVRTLEAENAALKVARDTYQREASEAKRQVAYWRKQAEKAAKDAA